ncbi:hypothetical protein EDI_248650, partial [Entamoeba dispar SAW760]
DNSTNFLISNKYYASFCKKKFKNPFIIAIIITKEINELKSFEFSHCVGLRKVEIPSSVSKIEKYCFKDCKKLELIGLHEGIEYEKGCFEGCEKLREVIEMDSSLFEKIAK